MCIFYGYFSHLKLFYVISRALTYSDIIEVYEIFIHFLPHHFCQFCHYKQWPQIKQVTKRIIKRFIICGVLIGGNCNKWPTTRTNKSANGWLSGQLNVSHNLWYVCNKRIFETIEIASISTTDTSEYKPRSLARFGSETLAKYSHLQIVVYNWVY